ncbi:MAG: tetratricopeptide repeat protein [Anaerolineales bacterium]
MAEQSLILASLKSIFPESSWPWAISALRHDPIIWSSLEHPDFFSRVSARSVEPRNWSPHKLALDSLELEQIDKLDEQVQTEAQTALNQFMETGSFKSEQHQEFNRAAMVALAFYHCYISDDWSEIKETINNSGMENNGWLTPIAIMVGFVKDQSAFIQQLIQNRSGMSILSLAVHATLCQPVPPEETRSLLKEVLTGLALRDAADLLNQISLSRPELGMQLANDWLEVNPLVANGRSSVGYGDQLHHLAENLLSAQIFSLAGQLQKAEQRKSRSLQFLNDLQIEVSNQMVGESLREKNIEYSLSQWVRTSAPPKLTPPAGLIVELLKADRIDDAINLLPDTDGNTQTPLRWLTNIYQALENDDLPQARLFGHQALNSFNEIFKQGISSAERSFGSRRDLLSFLSELIDRLADLALFKESFQAAKIFADLKPDDPQVLMTLTKTARSAGEHTRAVTAAQLAVALQPTHPEYRRQLAKSLESGGDWESALADRQAVLEHRFSQPGTSAWPLSEDMLAFADCALHAGHPDEAYEVCQKAVDRDPADGQAHAILGEALSALGKDEQAMEHFSLATQLSPHKAGPWLSLASAYQRTGQINKTIETLRTASHAVPDDPSIFFALGNVHLAEDSPSQAQPPLERAYQLVSEPLNYRNQSKSKKSGATQAELFARNREQLCEIALAYGNVLEKLGHQVSANKVFEDAYHAYPAFPGLAYIYAKSILEEGDESAALAPLAIAVSANPSQPQPYIDYARVLLKVNENPQEAVQSLEKALELLDNQKIEPGQDTAHTRYLVLALLAQAQEAAGQLLQSLQSYSQALETPIAEDERWKVDLAIGMGRVALQLDQPEIAIAALQDSSHREIQDTEVAQILCQAYTAIGLTQEALFAARSAVHLAPDDVDILSWFAERAIELGVMAEAVPALTSAAQLVPQRTDLIIRLATVHKRMGRDKAAREAFLSALSSPYSTPDDLYLAADGLSDLGDTESATHCLERALELQPQPPIDLVVELANAYKSASKFELAITTIDKGIDHYSENSLLHVYKADLLRNSGRQQAARSCLEHALILDPDNPTIHLQMAYILRDQHDLTCAYDHALQALGGLTSQKHQLAARGLAAELARSTMQDDLSHQLLESAPADIPKQENFEYLNAPSLLDYHCMKVETALELEEQIAAAGALNEAFKLAPEHPRVLALQSRMAIRQGNRESAQKTFASIFEQIESGENVDAPETYSANTLLSMALTALELFLWEQAADILERAVAAYQEDSNLHFQVAKMFVLRAEFQRLCQALDITRHAPGGPALSPRTFRLFEEAIQRTVDSLSSDLQAEQPQTIKRWVTRGKVAFLPSSQTVQNQEQLPEKPSDQAALITALAQSGDPDKISRLYHSIQSMGEKETLHHSIYAAYAFALYMTGKDSVAKDQAGEAILMAIDQNPTDAIYYLIQAKLAEQAGDWQIALSAMQTALSLWSDEPRWHSYLAKILFLNGQFPEAVAHYMSAIEMEPSYLQNYLDISQAYLRYGEPNPAIEILQEAIINFPDQSEPYLALANAKYENQNYSDAARFADKAAQIAPDQITPLLLGAKISLKLGDPGAAKSKAELALHKNPDDPAAMHIQAQALAAEGETERALELVEQAIPLASDPLPLHIQRANLLATSKNPQDLLAELKSIAEQYPDEALVLAPLARAYAETGQKAEAIQAAQQALHQGNQDLPLDEQAQLHHLLGQLLRQTGQLDQSIFQLSEAIRIAPQALDSYLELALTQEERRQHGPALETYKKAISMYPADPRPYYQASLLLKASRDYPAAESMLRKAAEKAPEDINIHRQLAALVALNLVHSRQPVTTEINSV